MIPKVARKRRDGKSSFVDLVTYVSIRDDVKMTETLSPETPFVRQSRSKALSFRHLIDYIDREAAPGSERVLAEFPDGRQQVRSGDVVCETNCLSLQTAAAEMNAVAAQSRKVEDPVYHFMLSWPVADKPDDADIFDSARVCLQQLGIAEHQFVTAIHRDTNHVHCHVAVNRVNPFSCRAAALYQDVDTLHKTCRRLELKYNWLPTNGAWVIEDGVVVRPKKSFRNAPDKARQLEYYADRESLFSYAVEQCREKLNTLFHEHNFSWNHIHEVLIEAGLELRRKGEGLAVYDNSQTPVEVPIKASRLHPALTLSVLEPRIGAFDVSPKAEYPEPNKLLYGYIADQYYNPSLHARDKSARAERRQQRANERDDLVADYKRYRNGWVRPTELKEDARTRFQALAADFRRRRETVSLITDPLLRKMLRHALAVDRMIATAALRVELKAEREALKASPDYRPQSYRQWVEVQAVAGNRAAISQLRGWAYRAKRSDRTPVHTAAVVRCGVADDIPPMVMAGYETTINRDGAITYLRDGKSVMVDKGERVEVTGNRKSDVAAAFRLTSQKSGEVLELRGNTDFVRNGLAFVSEYNRSINSTLPLTHPVQRQLAGYDQPQKKPDEPQRRVRPNNGPTYRP